MGWVVRDECVPECHSRIQKATGGVWLVEMAWDGTEELLVVMFVRIRHRAPRHEERA